MSKIQASCEEGQIFRSFLFLCNFQTPEFPEFWNCWKICFAQWDTNSLWKINFILHLQQEQNQAYNHIVFPSAHLGAFVAVPSQLARCNLLLKNTQSEYIYFYSIKVWMKKALLFVLRVEIKAEPTVR